VRARNITPKAFANSSPGLELATTLGYSQIKQSTLKGFAARGTLSGLNASLKLVPRVLAMLEPWAGVSERLRRISSSN